MSLISFHFQGKSKGSTSGLMKSWKKTGLERQAFNKKLLISAEI